MNFRPELAVAVMFGAKTATRRLVSDKPRSPWYRERCVFHVGKDFAVCPGRSKHQLGRAIVTIVERAPLGRLTLAQARAEGFPSVRDFEAAWKTINGAYDETALVWRVEFRRIDPEIAC